MKYSSGLKSTAFWFIESRKVAELMLEGYSKQEILDLALEENIFQVENASRKKEITNGVYRRLSPFSEDLLEYFLRTDTNSAKIFVLISILKDNRLFFEFMYEVYREHIILGNYTLHKADFTRFFMNKANQSETVADWNETTVYKLSSVYRLFMSEAGLLDTSGSEDIITIPFIDYRLRNLLEKDEKYVPYLKAITGES